MQRQQSSHLPTLQRQRKVPKVQGGREDMINPLHLIIGRKILEKLFPNENEIFREDADDEYYLSLAKTFSMRQPESIFFVGLFTTLMTAILLPFSLFHAYEKTLGQYLLLIAIFLPFAIFGIWNLLKASNWKVYVYGDQITYTSPTGKETKFTFKDITKVKWYQSTNSIIIYVGGKKLFSAGPAVFGINLLLARLKKEVPNSLISTSRW
jgi:hypothetical protein